MPIVDRLTVTVRLLKAQQNRCYYCNNPLNIKTPGTVHIDHMDPISKGGSDSIGNLCLACSHCNLSKRDKTAKEFYEYMRPYYLGVVSQAQLSEYNGFKNKYKKWHKTLERESEAEKDIEALQNLPPFTGIPPIPRSEAKLAIDIPLRYFRLDKDKRIIFLFGKHRGKPVDQVLEDHTDYIRWMLNTDFNSEVKRFLRQYSTNYSERVT